MWMCRPSKDRIHFDRFLVRKPAASDPSAPSLGHIQSDVRHTTVVFQPGQFRCEITNLLIESIAWCLLALSTACSESILAVLFSIDFWEESTTLARTPRLTFAFCILVFSSVSCGIKMLLMVSFTAVYIIKLSTLCCSCKAILTAVEMASSMSSFGIVTIVFFFNGDMLSPSRLLPIFPCAKLPMLLTKIWLTKRKFNFRCCWGWASQLHVHRRPTSPRKF